jgi:hypothetical protein
LNLSSDRILNDDDKSTISKYILKMYV